MFPISTGLYPLLLLLLVFWDGTYRLMTEVKGSSETVLANFPLCGKGMTLSHVQFLTCLFCFLQITAFWGLSGRSGGVLSARQCSIITAVIKVVLAFTHISFLARVCDHFPAERTEDNSGENTVMF